MKTDGMIYIHIPFCLRKCAYCDFYSGTFTEQDVNVFRKNILTEIRENAFSPDFPLVSSLYIGGGTPSSVSPSVLSEILEEVRKYFTFAEHPEISMEANPGTLTQEKLSAYKKMGINRLSLGLQSYDNRILQKIGRIHTTEDFIESYKLAREVGFSNINVDLMAGLPTDTEENFLRSLKNVITLKPEHISLYSLILEPGTRFYDLYASEKSAYHKELPSDETERKMIHEGKNLLSENGYHQYEISNFSISGKECRQNVGYWSHKPYIGFGPSAASFIGGKRFKNAPSKDYLNANYEETEILTNEDQMKEYMMLKFRMTEGVSEEEFRERFGTSFLPLFSDKISLLVRKGLLSSEMSEEGTRVFLSEKGLDFANLVFGEFL